MGKRGNPAFDAPKCERRTKPQGPPDHLTISAQHTIGHLESCPIIGVGGGSAANPGRMVGTAIGLGHRVIWPSPTFLGSRVWSPEVNELLLVRAAASAALLPGAPLFYFSQETRAEPKF